MEISIQKGTSVSLHEQLVTQISMQIAAGILKPDLKLPSIRALSKKLGIHHNTCLNAYKELEKGGLIQIRHGSGIRVTSTEQDAPRPTLALIPDAAGLDQLAAFFVQEIRRAGYSWSETEAALNRARQQVREQTRHPLIVVDIHADILPVFQTELQQALQRPVQQAVLGELDLRTEPNSHFVVSRYHYQTLKDQLKAALGKELSPSQLAERIIVIDVGAVRQELDLIKQLPPESLISVISSSTIILQQAEAVIKALRGEDVYIRPILAGHENTAEIQRVLKRSQAIFADWLCVSQLQQLTRKPIHTIRTIPTHEMEKLKAFQG